MAHYTLVVMAAGMGSRFGGLKQLEPVGAHGEVLLDYSVFDALRAGFDKTVFIIKKEIEADFRKLAGDRIARYADVSYVFQEKPSFRKKPFGTGEAVLLAADAVDTPFAVINADDFYGADAFRQIRKGLENRSGYCMVGYRLANTLSENGSVSRGICRIRDGYMTDIEETAGITPQTDLDPETVVSMNMWGLLPDIFPELKKQFASFLASADVTKDEFFIPRVIDRMVKEGRKQVRVYQTSSVWYGMTYREDKEKVTSAIAGMTAAGEYPEELWP